MSTTDVPSATKAAQVRLNRVTPSYCRVVLDNPPLNLMGPEFVWQIREVVTALENDDRVKVVVFESAVDALATRIASFDKWAIANTKRLVNEASLPPDVEMRAGWDACMASVKRPAAQERIKTLLEHGLQEPGDAQNRLGFHLGQLGLKGER